MVMKTLVQTLLQPVSPERRRVNAVRFLDLPDSLKTPEQIIGFAHHSCGATHGLLESCDFACTSCYLGEEANAAEPLSREEVFQQLDQLREFLGPQGKAQITAGEVTLLSRETLAGGSWPDPELNATGLRSRLYLAARPRKVVRES
jgi:hypothetical protein